MAIYKFGKTSNSIAIYTMAMLVITSLNQYTSGRPKMTNYTQNPNGPTPCGHFLNELREEKSGHHTKNNEVIPFNIP